MVYRTVSVMNFNFYFNFQREKAIWKASSLTSLQVPFETIYLFFHEYLIA